MDTVQQSTTQHIESSPVDRTRWHAESTAAALERLQSQRTGLTGHEAAARLASQGPNRLPPPQQVSPWAIAAAQLRGVVIYLLAACALVSLLMGEIVDAVAVTAVILINGIVGFVSEFRARRALDALLRLETGRARVFRDGRLLSVESVSLVTGDIVQLEPGGQVPADGRVIDVTDLRTNEAALTGESLPVTKTSGSLPAETPLAERHNMVFKGTAIVAGTGLAVVTATGPRTELGRIGALVAGVEEGETPLERQLDQLGRRLVWLALAIAAAIAVLRAAQGGSIAETVRLALALAVAAVPEALPVVATIALAVGVSRMARRRALVRRLAAVQSLGSATVVCTDKTRTLTSGDMTVVRIWTAGRDLDLGDERIWHEPAVSAALRSAALASRPQPHHDEAPVGDPVDAAMLRAASRAGVDPAALHATGNCERLIPFSTERKLMAAVWELDGHRETHVKGAPGRVLEHSSRTVDGEPIDDARRQALGAVNEDLARDGLRVLAVATRQLHAASDDPVRDLSFVGFVGLLDPPAAGVQNAIRQLRDAGLRTVMLTGDQHATARAVGRSLGLFDDNERAVETRELERLSPDQLREVVKDAVVFSRIAPADKLRVVEALQADGDIVAMLGDGINDAPALKRADVGVAMGVRGTDVAKDAAAIVLQDDRFDTIPAAIEEGRIILDNIEKFVFYLFSCNLAEIFVFAAAQAAGLPLPMLPLQVLWLNLVTDTFPALALAMEPGAADVMRRPPRDPHAAILRPALIRSIAGHAALIAVPALIAFATVVRVQPEQAVSVVFMALAFAQMLHLFNARAATPVLTLSRLAANPYALGAVALSAGLQLTAMYVTPLAGVLRIVPLDGSHWIMVAIVAAIPLLVGQSIRWWVRPQPGAARSPAPHRTA